MSYDFSSLSSADFEDLVRDLIGQALGLRFEAFGAGPDGGMDGRHATAQEATILQAKHYVRSAFKDLSAAMKRERNAIDRLAPSRYLLATSQSLTPANKNRLAIAIGPALDREGDIFSMADLNGLLRKYPEIEKAHIKLWLSSTAVLERVTRAAAHAYTAITVDEISAKVRVYATNPSFRDARNTLESEHVVIISGPPGVGKTTLAEMLSYAYVGEGWKLVPIRSLDDGFAAIVDTDKQIFLFDDFLGRIALDKAALATKDSDLSRFMRRVRNSPNARFVLTTRAYIFEEARRVSEYLADDRLNISKYVLDVGVYTRRIRARILYNHLLVAETPVPHIRSLVASGKIAQIVDHTNYNPRVVDWMTDHLHVTTIPPQEYAQAFISALANPTKLWDTAFRTHISEKCRHLLYALYFASEYGENIGDLRLAYQSLHPQLCAKYGHPHDSIDFEESLRILEGGFIKIQNSSVSFVNPSIRDYLREYLNDLELLKEFATSARQADWAREIWWHGKRIAGDAGLAEFATSFISVAREFQRIPTWKKQPNNPNAYSAFDLANADRIALLLDWWEASRVDEFARLAANLAAKPISGFSSWRDGRDLIELICDFKRGSYTDFPFEDEMLSALEAGVITMLEGGVESEDLDRILDPIYEDEEILGPGVTSAAQHAIQREFDEIDRTVAEIDSESTLEEHKAMLKKIGARAQIGESTLALALRTIDERIRTIVTETEEAESPSFTGATERDTDQFDDEALMNLFAPLLALSDEEAQRS